MLYHSRLRLMDMAPQIFLRRKYTPFLCQTHLLLMIPSTFFRRIILTCNDKWIMSDQDLWKTLSFESFVPGGCIPVSLPSLTRSPTKRYQISLGKVSRFGAKSASNASIPRSDHRLYLAIQFLLALTFHWREKPYYVNPKKERRKLGCCYLTVDY